MTTYASRLGGALLALVAAAHVYAAPVPIDPITAAALDDSIRTTAAEIATGNLNAQLRDLQRRADSLSVGQRLGMVELLMARGQYDGRIADREQALLLTEELGRAHPEDPQVLIARARGRAAFHRFADALADLDRAAALGGAPGAIDGVRAAIFQATARYDEALAIRRDKAQRYPSSATLGALASLLAERGEVENAARLFAEARRTYRDPSPFPLAFLLFDEGVMWMRHGELARAQAFLSAAHRRLPGYATAQCHLAEVEAALGAPQQAIALLQPLAATADDPDAAAQLARILAAQGDATAATWRAAAAARYDELLARHPEAYADHGAEFWLAAGNDPRRALALAQRNLLVRQTPRAYELVLAAALASGDHAVTCATRARVAGAPNGSAQLATLLDQAAAACAVEDGDHRPAGA